MLGFSVRDLLAPILNKALYVARTGSDEVSWPCPMRILPKFSSRIRLGKCIKFHRKRSRRLIQTPHHACEAAHDAHSYTRPDNTDLPFPISNQEWRGDDASGATRSCHEPSKTPSKHDNDSEITGPTQPCPKCLRSVSRRRDPTRIKEGID